ncbi:MAG TPA: tetratricopeptide repeat protein [Chthonomonadales bacterium]|nr:tetratricopeptide repeat protein [Chthonomonadales bacterium]
MAHHLVRCLITGLALGVPVLAAHADGWRIRGHFCDDGTYIRACCRVVPDNTCDWCEKTCPHGSSHKAMKSVEGPLSSRRDPYAMDSLRVDIGRVEPVVRRAGRRSPVVVASREIEEVETMPAPRSHGSPGPCFQSVIYDASIEEAYYLYGIGFFQQGALGEARKAFSEAAGALPNSEVVQYNLGVVCANMGYWDEAEKAFRKAMRLNPNFVAAKAGFHHIRLHRGDAPAEREILPEKKDAPASIWDAKVAGPEGNAVR